MGLPKKIWKNGEKIKSLLISILNHKLNLFSFAYISLIKWRSFYTYNLYAVLLWNVSQAKACRTQCYVEHKNPCNFPQVKKLNMTRTLWPLEPPAQAHSPHDPNPLPPKVSRMTLTLVVITSMLDFVTYAYTFKQCNLVCVFLKTLSNIYKSSPDWCT